MNPSKEDLLNLIRELVNVKDTRIAQLEKDNEALKAQLEELEALLP